MANWKGFSLTDKGFDLQSKVDAGTATLRFTKISIGSGKAQGSVPSELVHKEKDLTIGSITPEGPLVKIVSTLTNVGVKKAFKEQEIGLYAQDPDEGEILFAYMTDDSPDTLPAEGSTTIVTKRITLALTFSNTENITAVLDGNQLMTFGDLVSKTMDPSASSNVDGKAPSTSWVQNAIATKVSARLETHRTKTSIDHPDRSVTEAKLANNAVSTRTIRNEAVTLDKLAVNARPSDTADYWRVNKAGNLVIDFNNLNDNTVYIGREGKNDPIRPPLTNWVFGNLRGGLAAIEASRFIGAADRANKLTLPRIISLTGDIIGSASFDGSENVAIRTSINNDDYLTSDNFQQNLTDNGWSKLPNGLILQWGWIANNNGSAEVVFPVAFSQKCFSIAATHTTAVWDPGEVSTWNITTTGFNVGGQSANKYNWYWLAVGY